MAKMIVNETHANLLVEAQKRKAQEEAMRIQEQAIKTQYIVDVRKAALASAVSLVGPEVRNGKDGVTVNINVSEIIGIAQHFEHYIYSGKSKREENKEHQAEEKKDSNENGEVQDNSGSGEEAK